MAQPHQASSGRSLYDVLAAPLTAISITKPAQPSTSTPIVLPGIRLGKWQLSRVEILDRVKQELGDRPSTLPGPNWAPLELNYRGEFQINRVFDMECLERINYVNRQLSDDGMVEDQYCWLTARNLNNNMAPDFLVMRLPGNGDMQPTMPVEGKFLYDMDTEDLYGLILDESAPEQKEACFALCQLALYMLAAGSLCGAITTHSYTFAVRRASRDSDDLRFWMSRGFFCAHHSTNVSVPLLLKYLELLERDARAGQPTPPPDSQTNVVSLPFRGVKLEDFERPAKKLTRNDARNACESSSVKRKRAPGGIAGCLAAAARNSNVLFMLPGLEVIITLSQGQCGITHLARYKGKRVVVKSADAANAQDIVQVLQKEAAAYAGPLNQLCGKYVPTLEYAGFTETGDMYLLVLGYIEGEHLDPESVTPVASESARQALAAVHKQGLAHGDISQRNVILQGNKVWLIGFENAYQDPSSRQQKYEMKEMCDLFQVTKGCNQCRRVKRSRNCD